MATGTVFNIQRFSVHDGPGIRTTVFLKGCPLHCQWCHNPESLKSRPQVLYEAQSCAGCRACARVCPKGCHVFQEGRHIFDPGQCIGCQSCARVCAYNALQACGRTSAAREVLETVLRDRDFYAESGGGLTLSGGEPLLQPDFAAELLDGAHGFGISCAVESCGIGTREALRRVFERADLVLLDWKLSDAEKLKAYTGAEQETVLSALTLLYDMQKRVWLRCPLIPGVNDEDAHFAQIAALAKKYTNIEEIQIMPYHSFGNEKRVRLGSGTAQEFRTPGEAEIAEWIKKISDRRPGIPVKRG